MLLKFIRPSGSTVSNCHNPKGVKLLLTSLRLGLNHIRELKFKHDFKIHLTQYAAVILKYQLIFFFTVLIIQMKD